jgi:hypothetical protein
VLLGSRRDGGQVYDDYVCTPSKRMCNTHTSATYHQRVHKTIDISSIRIIKKVMSIVFQHDGCDLLPTRTTASVDINTEDDSELIFARRKFTEM